MMAMTSEKPGVPRHISRTFLAGLLAALPLTLTLAVIVWLVEFIHRFMGPGSALGRMLRSIGLKLTTSELVAYLIGIVMTLTLIYFLGMLVEAGMKHRWSTLVDSTMDRVPLVRSIYSALKRLMQMFEGREEGKPFFAYLAFTTPHDPMHVPEPWLGKYRGNYDDGYEALKARRGEGTGLAHQGTAGARVQGYGGLCRHGKQHGLPFRAGREVSQGHRSIRQHHCDLPVR
jgi:hypothetical protein